MTQTYEINCYGGLRQFNTKRELKQFVRDELVQLAENIWCHMGDSNTEHTEDVREVVAHEIARIEKLFGIRDSR